MAILMFWVVHWGVLSAYLPQRAESVGANIGSFFAADGLFVLLARIPAGGWPTASRRSGWFSWASR